MLVIKRKINVGLLNSERNCNALLGDCVIKLQNKLDEFYLFIYLLIYLLKHKNR